MRNVKKIQQHAAQKVDCEKQCLHVLCFSAFDEWSELQNAGGNHPVVVLYLLIFIDIVNTDGRLDEW